MTISFPRYRFLGSRFLGSLIHYFESESIFFRLSSFCAYLKIDNFGFRGLIREMEFRVLSFCFYVPVFSNRSFLTLTFRKQNPKDKKINKSCDLCGLAYIICGLLSTQKMVDQLSDCCHICAHNGVAQHH